MPLSRGPVAIRPETSPPKAPTVAHVYQESCLLRESKTLSAQISRLMIDRVPIEPSYVCILQKIIGKPLSPPLVACVEGDAVMILSIVFHNIVTRLAIRQLTVQHELSR